MNGNYSPLQRNTLDGMSEAAGILYLRLCDKFEAHKSPANERRAFWEADRFERQCAGTLGYILDNYPDAAKAFPDGTDGLPAELKASLSEFFAKRWQHNFMEERKP